MNGNLITVSHKFETIGTDFLIVATELKNKIKYALVQQLDRLAGIKWYIYVQVKFNKHINNEEIHTNAFFHGKTRSLLPSDPIDTQYSESLDNILESVAKWIIDGRGCVIENV